MGYLKYYAEERLANPLQHGTVYKTPKEANKTVKKLIRHFKLQNRIGIIKYNLSNGRGLAFTGGIALPKKNIHLSIICHEIGHHVAKKKTGQWNHNHKTFMKMKQVYKYAEKFIDLNSRLQYLNISNMNLLTYKEQ